jgi:hypothetical protein
MARQPRTINYIREASPAKISILNCAALFAGYATYQLMIDAFLARIERRTTEILDRRGANHVETRRMVADVVDQEILPLLERIDSEAGRRLQG